MPKEGMLERFQTVGCLVKAAKNQKGSNQKFFHFVPAVVISISVRSKVTRSDLPLICESGSGRTWKESWISY